MFLIEFAFFRYASADQAGEAFARLRDALFAPCTTPPRRTLCSSTAGLLASRSQFLRLKAWRS